MVSEEELKSKEETESKEEAESKEEPKPKEETESKEEPKPEQETKKAPGVEGKHLRDYEMVLVISPEVVDEALDTKIKSITQFIIDKGGVVSEVEQWGKKRLAYPVEHFMEGSYVLTRFKLEPVLSKELEKNLKMSEEVLRHLLIRVGD